MKTRIVCIDHCNNMNCKLNIAHHCCGNPEIDNHLNCLTCSNKTNFKVKKENICQRY